MVLSRQPFTISSITAFTKNGEARPEDMKSADDWKPKAKANYDIEH